MAKKLEQSPPKQQSLRTDSLDDKPYKTQPPSRTRRNEGRGRAAVEREGSWRISNTRPAAQEQLPGTIRTSKTRKPRRGTSKATQLPSKARRTPRGRQLYACRATTN